MTGDLKMRPDYPLSMRLPPQTSGVENSDLLDLFLGYVSEKKLELYPAQEEALLHLFDEKNVILNTPTGSGKSLVALALHFKSLATGRRSVYTCPIKALVNEKFLSLCKDFGPEYVGMITGDGSVNRDAPIICCTAEILANMSLREGSHVNFDDVIADEFHYYADKQRGVAWQIPLLTMSRARFLLMSATLGDATPFQDALTKLNGVETILVGSDDRPVPLTFEYRETPLHETIENLITTGRAPIYVVNFTQRDAAEEAQNLLSTNFCSKEEKTQIAQAVEGVKFKSPYGKEFQKILRHGIGIHHGGLLPKYRILVEGLAQKGLLKIISGTDTLGVGVNVPIRTVLFTKLCKYDGEKTAILSVRDFNQISGRAGRRGFDTSGTVIVQAPEHVIENLKLERKADGDSKKLRKIVKRQPPEKGYIPWDKAVFNRLVTSEPESLISRFQISHGMLLNVLSRENEDGCKAIQKIIRHCHESTVAKKKLSKTAFQLFRSLVDRKIIEFTGVPQHKLRIHVDLQEDFSLNHALSLYLLDTIKLLDKTSETYALDLLTLVESIIEDPDLILRKQLDRVKTEKMGEMKAAGVEYEERLLELDKLEYPKPNRDFIYNTFNEFAAKHPWVGQENIRPKSIAREMFENFQSFDEYIRDYDLQRAEGLLLRYLTEVYKALLQTVPEVSRDNVVEEITVYFENMVRQIDSSLLDEWEKLRGNVEAPLGEKPSVVSNTAANKKRDKKTLEILLRNQIFQFVRALSLENYESALEFINTKDNSTWTAAKLEEAMKPYFTDHQRICTDTKARSASHTHFEELETPSNFKIEQILVDPEGKNDWSLEFTTELTDNESEMVFLNLKSIAAV
jgi:superfamily II RNA helicase